MSAFVDNLEFIDPLEPRDAFFGGRTNAVKLYHLADIDSDEQMKYYDFTSLYSWVNKNGKYPVGHPEIISQPNTTDIREFFGLAKCTVTPPRKVVPSRTAPTPKRKAHVFPVCHLCGRRNGKTHARAKQHLYPHRPAARGAPQN